MASGTLDADKIRKDNSKWGECSKVYTRRPKKDIIIINNNNKEQTILRNDVLNDVSNDYSGQSQRDKQVVAANGVVTPIVRVVDDKVKIHLEGSTSKNDIKELKEKFEHELGQVRSLVQRLEDKEAEITRFDNVVGTADNDTRFDNVVGTADNDTRYDNAVGTADNDTRYDNVVGTADNDTCYDNVVGAADNDESYRQLEYHRQLEYQYPSVDVAVDRRALVRVDSGMGADYIDRRGLTRVYSDMGADYIDRRGLTRVGSEVGSFENQDMFRFRQLSVSVGEYVEKEKRTPKANQYYRNSDFLLGKDRLPPESNKKLKANGGRKSDYAIGYERHRNQVFRSCSSLLQRLMKHKFGWVFNEPVNAKLLGLHDYHDIIKHPMDLGTVKSRLAQNFYKTPVEFAEDVRLTFRNAMTYNPKGQDVHVMAEQLLDIFEEKWVVIESDWRYGPVHISPVARKVNNYRTLDRSQSMGLPFMARPKPPSFAPVTRTPVPKKPKARDPNKRDMTYDEKQKLSANLQSLPAEKLDSIVQIINKSNNTLAQNGDEIEVDIDSVDTETLWELDRFVLNYRKNLSKHKRKAEKAMALAANTNGAVLQNSTASVPQAPPEKRADEPNPAVNMPNQGGDNVSSSSSSSSDSGSSSSDSDSDSSSGSDAGQ